MARLRLYLSAGRYHPVGILDTVPHAAGAGSGGLDQLWHGLGCMDKLSAASDGADWADEGVGDEDGDDLDG